MRKRHRAQDLIGSRRGQRKSLAMVLPSYTVRLYEINLDYAMIVVTDKFICVNHHLPASGNLDFFRLVLQLIAVEVKKAVARFSLPVVISGDFNTRFQTSQDPFLGSYGVTNQQLRSDQHLGRASCMFNYLS